MGNEMSEGQRKELERKEVEHYLKTLKPGPDLKVNKSIVIFCSLSASDNLKQHYEKRKVEAGDQAATLIKNLVEKLGDLTPAPALAGLGGLAIAILIDILFPKPPQESTKEALRSVFAEEKASEVWDLIDECLKRCTMNIKNKDKLKSDIERLECQLSTALTKLKNSMLRDGHMSSPALKAWVNGASFHIQMLIHLVRLGGIQTCDPVKNLLSTYESDLEPLFKKHKETIRTKCGTTFMVRVDWLKFEDSDLYGMNYETSVDKYFEVYYNHRYTRQKPEIQQHFTDVRKNLQGLIGQKGSFKVR